MRLCSPKQPYPGLRPFEPQEAEYFCGRKQEIRRLEGMIQEQRFVAVLGSSGAGKSSLILAGVLPGLAEERLSTSEPAWQVLRMRPGGAPFRALADQAAELAHRLHPEQAASGTALRDRALGLLRRGSQGLRQVAGELGLASGVRLLLIVDQFEELFRYKGIDQHQARREDEETRDRSDEAAAFAAALLATGECDSPPVHVVITMRSDFVGEAARFLGLPEAIDAGQFLVPRMSRAQMEAAIREPLKLASATISPALVQRLLNDTGTEPDALPVMQHALLRTWEEAGAEATASAPGQDHGEMPAPDTSGRKLLPRHYEAAGRMAHALSQHSNAILDKLGEDRELPEVARWLFRALAEVDKEGRAVRRPQRYAEFLALMGCRRRKQVQRVLDRFRDDDCHFLTPFISAVPGLKADTVIDVTHEALLRNWDKLRGGIGKVGWLGEEFEDGLIWRGLVIEAEKFAEDPKCILGAGTAKRQEKWIAGLPSPYWARRHSHPATDAAAGPKQDDGSHEWHQVSRLITASSQAADRQERWRLITLGSVVFVAVLMLVLSVFAWSKREQAQRNADEAKEITNTAISVASNLAMSHGEADEQAVILFRAGASRNYAIAQYNLGWMYEGGRGVAKDEVQAVQWYRKAAESYRKAADQGDASAQYNLGWIYVNGRGVAKDEVQAVQWYRKAADQGNATAQYNLGGMYEGGGGVAKDEVQAVQWYRKAADQGDPYAYERLHFIYHEKLFAFVEAFDLNRAWLQRHPDNLDAQANFAEAAFTIGRFSEAEQWLATLVNEPKLKPATMVALRALEICSLVALDRADTLRAKLDALGDLLKDDRDELAADRTFAGSRHFIGEHSELSRHPWLIQLLAAVEKRNAADARVAVGVGQATSAAAIAQ